MGDNPFDACWERLERSEHHQCELVGIWNAYIEDHPYDFSLVHHGGGVHVLQVWQERPIPPAFAIELGEWLYNARACLDYIIWATCAYTTGSIRRRTKAHCSTRSTTR